MLHLNYIKREYTETNYYAYFTSFKSLKIHCQAQ